MAARARAAKAPRAKSPPDAATHPDAVTAETAPPAESPPDAATHPDAVTAETAPPAESPPDAATKPDTAAGALKTRVKTLQDGQNAYWRGGQAHTKAWRAWPAGTYSAEQVERLQADERVEVAPV